jgi:hypothetical protein
MIKITVSYQILGYKTLELVVKSEPISIFDYYDPTSISGSNPVMPEERTHSRAREQQPSCVPVQNVEMNEDEGKKRVAPRCRGG